MTTYEEAIDEIFEIFKVAWDANSAAIVGYVPEIRWQGVEEPNSPDYSKFWCRVSQQTVIEQQSGFRNGECKPYTTEGLVFIQIFCPKSDSESMTKGRKLAIVGRDAFRGNSTSGKVWFKNARVNELPAEIQWIRLNVVAEYEYDEIE